MRVLLHSPGKLRLMFTVVRFSAERNLFMIFSCYFDGCKVKQGKNGMYADVYLRVKLPNGHMDPEQLKFRSFSENVVSLMNSHVFKPGDEVNVDLQVRDAFVQSIESSLDMAVEL